MTNMAYKAGQNVRKIYDSYKNKSKRIKETKPPKDKKKGSEKSGKSMTGLYQGEGKFAGKFRKAKKGKFQLQPKNSNKGFTYVRETVGTVSDPNCCYIYSHVFCPSDIVFAVSCGIARKICEASFDCKYAQITDLVLGGNASPISGNYLLSETHTIGYLQSVGSSAFAINNSTTVANVGSWIRSVLDYYTRENRAADADNLRVLEYFTLYKQLSANTDSLVVYTMNVSDEIVIIDGKVEVKVQNRSLSASGGSGTDVVDSNPVQGFVYDFTSVPKLRAALSKSTTTVFAEPSYSLFQDIRYNDGMNLIRGAQLSIVGNGREPINGRTFYNCTSQGRIRLEPGAIKKCSKGFQIKMRLTKFLNNFGNAISPTDRISDTMKGGLLLSFEDVINVNAAANITMTYEVEHMVTSMMKTVKNTPMISGFAAGTYDNLAV